MLFGFTIDVNRLEKGSYYGSRINLTPFVKSDPIAEEISMDSKGIIYANLDRLNELFREIIIRFSQGQSRLAIWVMNELELLPLSFQNIGAESPFPESKSVLAGTGFLIDIRSETATQLIEILTTEDRLEYEIIHLQIEYEGRVQLAAYDRFEHILFGDAFSLDLLETLKTDGVIGGYEVFADDTQSK